MMTQHSNAPARPRRAELKTPSGITMRRAVASDADKRRIAQAARYAAASVGMTPAEWSAARAAARNPHVADLLMAVDPRRP